MPKIPLSEGRHLFGSDPLAYANGRPDYPEELYQRLRTRCELGPGVSAFEIGAGTGLATQRLLALGVWRLWAIEPDPRLAAYLRETISSSWFRVDESAFEEAELPEAEFDLGVAANLVSLLGPELGTNKGLSIFEAWWLVGNVVDAFRLLRT
jgi:SAM-dependent methyltransferase